MASGSSSGGADLSRCKRKRWSAEELLGGGRHRWLVRRSAVEIYERIHDDRHIASAFDDHVKGNEFGVLGIWKLFFPVVNGVAHAQQRGVMHRDLKSDNLTLCMVPFDLVGLA